MITWDEPKRLANLDKHGLDFAEFETAFGFADAKVAAAKPGLDGRPRSLLMGTWNGQIVVVAIVSALGSEAIALISLRHASRKERIAYERR